MNCFLRATLVPTKKPGVTVNKALTDFQQKGFCSLLNYFLIFFSLSSRVGNKSRLKKYIFFYVESNTAAAQRSHEQPPPNCDQWNVHLGCGWLSGKRYHSSCSPQESLAHLSTEEATVSPEQLAAPSVGQKHPIRVCMCVCSEFFKAGFAIRHCCAKLSYSQCSPASLTGFYGSSHDDKPQG